MPINTFGAYFWGGYNISNVESALSAGCKKLQEAGFTSIARVLLTPSLRKEGASNVYKFNLPNFLKQCPLNKPFLPAAIRSTFYKELFSLPGLKTFVLTTYDSVTHGPTGDADNFFRPDFFNVPANSSSVFREYRDMTLALYETQNGSGKRFIICNWETDNHLYSVGAYGFVTLPDKKLACLSTFPRPAERVEGFVQWFKLRQKGIREGRVIAAARGLGGIEVHDAIEFATYKLLENGGSPNALFDIVLRIKPDYASYSCWETCESGRLDEDLREIKGLLGSTKLIIGEFGHKQMAQQNGSTIAWRFVKSARAIARAELSAAIVWEGFETAGLDDGLLNSDGTEKQIMNDLRVGLQNYPEAPTQINILGAVDRGVTNGKRFFELYGKFPGASQTAGKGYSATVDCEGQMLVTEVVYESTGQINISIPANTQEKWCTIKVTRLSNKQISPEFGPRRMMP